MRIDRVKLIAEMARKDLTTLDLAETSGLSRGTITGIRSGKSCSKASADKLAKGLGVPVSDIIEKGG
ncbi:helix-turn-helix domain-containing protein [Acutalibacter caecimuris]|uniref:helix-turn-helix domain-containing protein n=1 Tax=Acutalibacter caecimuris TaxID=3093657 RepID=UPI002AC98873|nr:helix-turn-helix transcriptional regulator [Acutalibacter sp. M00118]